MIPTESAKRWNDTIRDFNYIKLLRSLLTRIIIIMQICARTKKSGKCTVTSGYVPRNRAHAPQRFFEQLRAPPKYARAAKH